MDETFMDKMHHQQMLLYIVCGLGGICLITILLCIVCKCKADRDRRKADEKRKSRRKNQNGTSRSKSIKRGSKINPKEIKQANVHTENRSRRRSMDMRHENRQNGGNKQVSIEDMDGHI